MVIYLDGVHEIVVEAKVVGANAEYAAREAIGQLFSYRHFYYRCRDVPDPGLLAIFSDDIGPGLMSLMESLGIQVAWLSKGHWRGWMPENS